MTPELETLARRAVACPRWRWMQGMSVAYFLTPGVVIDGARIGTFRLAVVWAFAETRDYGGLRDEEIPLDILPDLSDPATLGCLLALVQEKHAAPHAYVEVRPKQRARVLAPAGLDGARVLVGWVRGTEAAALVAALEAAP